MNKKKKTCQISETLTILKIKNIVKQKTCFKNPDRPTFIDLILTNSSRSFQDTCTIQTGFSNFNKLVVTALKLYFPKQKPNIQTSRDYQKLSKPYELSKLNVCNLEFEHFLNIFIEVLNNHAKRKPRGIHDQRTL